MERLMERLAAPSRGHLAAPVPLSLATVCAAGPQGLQWPQWAGSA